MRRLLCTLAGGLLLVLALAGGAVTLAVWLSLPQLDGARTLPGLTFEARLERDAFGVPTVTADNREDLARALGYAHAQDRFFQMDLLRRMAAGELAALVGPGALETDRTHRRHRLRTVAAGVLEEATSSEKSMLHAYTEGVNAGLEDLRLPPPEYLLLRSSPDPWAAEDSILVLHAMWLRLTDPTGQRERRLAAMRDTLPAALVDFIVPAGTAWDVPLQGEAFELAPLPGPEVFDLRAQAALEQALPPSQDSSEPHFGSNVWAISKERGDQGRAWLANDMHLGLSVPNTWYRARLILEQSGGNGFDIVGATLPGLPTAVVGSNGHVAWGFANSYGDWTDVRRVRPEQESDAFLLDGNRLPVTRHIERIAVRGGETEALVVKETPYGVILEFDQRHYAVQWLGRHQQASNLSLLGLERARTLDEALSVAQRSGIPPQNFVAVDRHGDIGWTIAGRIPARDGQGWLPSEDYPQLVNPEDGQIVAANARMVDGPWLELLGDGGYDLAARQRQIVQLLADRDALDGDDMLAVQLDHRALLLQRWQKRLLALLEDQPEPLWRQAREKVAGWSAQAGTDDVGYRLVREWRDELARRVFYALTVATRKDYPDFAFRRFHQSEEALWQLVRESPEHLLDPRYESWAALEKASFDVVLERLQAQHDSLEQASWGEANRLDMRHPLSATIPGRWLDMPDNPVPGDRDMPRVQGPRFGASQRMAVSPGHESEGYFHMPGGQSAHPLSPYYRRGHAAWERGEQTPFLPGKSEHMLRLQPAR